MNRDALDDESIVGLLALLASEPDCSVPRACKRMRLSASELWRMLSVLSGDGSEAMGLVDVIDAGEPARLRLSPRGRALLQDPS